MTAVWWKIKRHGMINLSKGAILVFAPKHKCRQCPKFESLETTPSKALIYSYPKQIQFLSTIESHRHVLDYIASFNHNRVGRRPKDRIFLCDQNTWLTITAF